MCSEVVLKRKVIEEINGWLDSGTKSCIVVKGARQVGKSYAVMEVLRARFDSYVVLDFRLKPELSGIFEGDLGVDGIIKKMKTYFRDFEPVPGKTAIFLDEIQGCPNARASLKSFALDGRYVVIASGSLLGLDYSAVPSYPVGYEHEIVMRSLDFEEFLWALNIDQDIISYLRQCISSKTPIDDFILKSLDDYFRLYLAVGGMPAVVKAYLEKEDVTDARRIQEDILVGYRDDIGKYSAFTERNKIFACFDSIPIQLSKENKKFTYSKIPNAVSPSTRKYRRSIDWLEDAGICNLCYNISEPKMPFEERDNANDFKLYMADTGLLLAMLSDDVAHAVMRGDVRVNKGALVENMVAECLIKCGVDIHYFSKNNLEIDFITSMRGNVVAIEVKSGNNKRAKSLISIKDNYGVKRRMKFENTNICITPDGVEHYPLFASAFADSMYEKYDLHSHVADPGKVNARLKEISGNE